MELSVNEEVKNYPKAGSAFRVKKETVPVFKKTRRLKVRRL